MGEEEREMTNTEYIISKLSDVDIAWILTVWNCRRLGCFAKEKSQLIERSYKSGRLT